MINTGFLKNNHFAYNCLNATSHYTNCPCNSSHWKRLHEGFSSGYTNTHTSMPLFFFTPVELCYKMEWSCYLFVDYSLSFLEGILSKARRLLFCPLTNQIPTTTAKPQLRVFRPPGQLLAGRCGPGDGAGQWRSSAALQTVPPGHLQHRPARATLPANEDLSAGFVILRYFRQPLFTGFSFSSADRNSSPESKANANLLTCSAHWKIQLK